MNAPSTLRRVIVLSLLQLVVLACGSTVSPQGISEDRAIEIARSHISFEPTSTEAHLDTHQGTRVWIVTFRRAAGSHGGLGQFAEVTLDARTGSVVAVAMS